MGRVLGPSKNEDDKMAQSVSKETEIVKQTIFDKIAKEQLGDSMTLPPSEITPSVVDSSDFIYDTREDDEDEDETLGWVNGDLVDVNRIPVFENSLSDSLINADVLLPNWEELITVRLKSRHKNDNSVVLGVYDPKPNLKLIPYDVVFPN